MKKQTLAVIIIITFIATFAFTASGPSDQIIKEQVIQRLNSLRPTSYAYFPNLFSIQSIAVKDRLVELNTCTVIVDFTVQLKQNYAGDEFLVFKEYVRQRGNQGDIVTNSLTVTFKRFEKGWRIVKFGPEMSDSD